MSMNPAKSILDLVGIENAARVTGKHISRIYRWTYPAARGGTGGVIPHTDALKLLQYARQTGIALNETDFMQEPTLAPAEDAA